MPSSPNQARLAIPSSRDQNLPILRKLLVLTLVVLPELAPLFATWNCGSPAVTAVSTVPRSRMTVLTSASIRPRRFLNQPHAVRADLRAILLPIPVKSARVDPAARHRENLPRERSERVRFAIRRRAVLSVP